jgi:putative phage-type endonuclease
MEQNTDEWIAWRRGGVGSSDAPAIMGVSPYMTIYDLWLDKQGLYEGKKRSDFVMRLGQEFEPKVRARFELETDIIVEPAVVEHSDEPWIRSSLDACSFYDCVFAEIKYVGNKKLEEIKSSMAVLPHHYPQIQHQFLTTGFSHAYYVAYTLSEDKKEIADYFSLKVDPDPVYICSLLYPNVKEFWRCVTNKIPPGGDSDTKGPSVNDRKKRRKKISS